jgi:hypothetical protein
MKTQQYLKAFDEAYEVVCTKVVCIEDRTFRLEVRKCLKGNLKGKHDCCFYEEDECRKNPKDAPKVFWRRTSMPDVREDNAIAAMKRALSWIEEMFSASGDK